MKYYLIAGEASGDLHGSNLIKEIKLRDAHAEFRGWGGQLMEEQGCLLVKHYRDTSFMGFLEVLLNLRAIYKLLSLCRRDLIQYQPDVLILIDYPGFNLRMAAFAKKHQLRVFYYISPQIWAWKKSRVHHIKRAVDKMFVILPFEKKFYEKFNYPVEFVGHPLLDAVEQFYAQTTGCRRPKPSAGAAKPVLAILPGSRRQEIGKMLPLMIQAASCFDAYEPVIAGLNVHGPSFYDNLLSGRRVKIVYDDTYELLSIAHAAVVTSGTATLETALFNVPEVVCYKANSISYVLAKLFVGRNIEYISLVNLIAGREVVKELLQEELSVGNVVHELQRILETERRQEILTGYGELKALLGGGGASARTAELMVNVLTNNIQKNL